MFDVRKNIIVRITTDVALIALLHLSYFVIKASSNKQLGFDCADKTLRLPYKPDTVSILSVILYGYLLPILTIVSLELSLSLYQRLTHDPDHTWMAMASTIYNFISVYGIAAGVTFMLTSVIKYSLGRPRPHFWEVCVPDVGNCMGYISDVRCTGTNQHAVKEVFLSFLSGHASNSAVGVTYAVLYLQERLHLKFAPMLRPLIQAIYVSSGLYIVLTRFIDFHHHWTDLVSGTALGVVCGLFFFLRYLTQMKKVRL